MSEDRQDQDTGATRRVPINLGLLHPIGTPQVTPVHALAPGAQSLGSLMIQPPRQDSLFPAETGQQYLSQGPIGSPTVPVGQSIDPSLASVPGTGAHAAYQANLERAANVALAFGPGQFRAYHGTGATPFEQFLDEFIGTGEGAQAYSWGHYVAQKPGVAKSYTPEEGGNLLNVWVKPEHEEFLDWDLPLHAQEPGVQDKLIAMDNPDVSLHGFRTGKQVYGDLVSHFAMDNTYNESTMLASKELDEAGIPGMRFLDQQSRGLPETSLQYNMPSGGETLPSLISEKMGGASSPNDLLASLLRQLDVNTRHIRNLTPSPSTRALEDFPGYSQYVKPWQDAIGFLDRNADRFTAVPNKNRTYNYVVYDPKNIEITHRDGERVHTLEPVDHDPWAEQKAVP